MLEKLETDYAGRFKLVKIDSDAAGDRAAAGADVRRAQHPDLRPADERPAGGRLHGRPARRRGPRSSSTSTCRAPDEQAAQEQLQEAEELLAEGDSDAALERLQHAVATDPANDDARFDYVTALLLAGRIDDAKVAFAPVANAVVPGAPLRLAAGAGWTPWMRRTRPAPSETLAAAIAANKRDFDARFDTARLLMAQQRLDRGDGRAAGDPDARQGLERGPGAQDLHRDPRGHEQARDRGRGRGAEAGHARGRRQDRRRAGRPGGRRLPAQLSMVLF